MSYEKNGLKVTVSFNKDKLKLAILKSLSEGEKHGSQLRKSIVEGLIPEDFCRTEVSFALLELERDGLVDGDYKIIEQPSSTTKGLAGKFYHIKKNVT